MVQFILNDFLNELHINVVKLTSSRRRKLLNKKQFTIPMSVQTIIESTNERSVNLLFN